MTRMRRIKADFFSRLRRERDYFEYEIFAAGEKNPFKSAKICVIRAAIDVAWGKGGEASKSRVWFVLWNDEFFE